MKAQWRNQTVAEAADTLERGGYRYFPRSVVRMNLLRATPRTADDLRCPHGVQFFDLVDGTQSSERAAWSYEAPQPALADVDHWIGFWKDVAIVE